MRKDTNGAAPTIFFLRSVPFFTCPTLLPLQNPHFRCPCSALASATRRYVERPSDTCCLRLGRIYAEHHHQLARVADSPTLFPVYMKSREAHFLAAAGPRGGWRRGRLKSGRRSDNLFFSKAFLSLRAPLLFRYKIRTSGAVLAAPTSATRAAIFGENILDSSTRVPDDTRRDRVADEVGSSTPRVGGVR
jgi:hypothetical protein